LILTFISIIQLRTTLTHSDAGHILLGLYPSIICVFIILFFIGRKRNEFVLTVFQTIKNKPHFFQIYSIPQQFYSEEDAKNISSFISATKKPIFVYPYDNYLLNISEKTFNSFALQVYDYSGSIVEQK